MPIELAPTAEAAAAAEAERLALTARVEADRAQRDAAERQAAKEAAEAEDAALRAQLMPGWLLANPTAGAADFARLWPLLKEQHAEQQRRAAFDAALTAKANSAEYANWL